MKKMIKAIGFLGVIFVSVNAYSATDVSVNNQLKKNIVVKFYDQKGLVSLPSGAIRSDRPAAQARLKSGRHATVKLPQGKATYSFIMESGSAEMYWSDITLNSGNNTLVIQPDPDDTSSVEVLLNGKALRGEGVAFWLGF